MGPSGGEIWEVPSGGTGGGLDHGIGPENCGDGRADRQGESGKALRAQSVEDVQRAELIQGIALAEVVAKGENALALSGGRAAGGPGVAAGWQNPHGPIAVRPLDEPSIEH